MTRLASGCFASFAGCILCVVLPARGAEGPPVAPVRPVTTTYFGTAVTDDYRYMENLQDPEVRAWQSRYLVANSASAGGIIMGGALTLDPGLFRVVLDDVGMSDTLRSETEPNGPPNVPEFGSTSQEEGFHALYSMSAYAHVHDGTPYPAVMFTTGANDPRVASWHMLKMAARVQAATSSGRPVLLRIDYDAGHGIGSSVMQRVNLLADEWAFAFWQLGLPAYQPRVSPGD